MISSKPTGLLIIIIGFLIFGNVIIFVLIYVDFCFFHWASCMLPAENDTAFQARPRLHDWNTLFLFYHGAEYTLYLHNVVFYIDLE